MQPLSDHVGTDLAALERQARGMVQVARQRFPQSAICWSGGKDSMVLLHLLREEGITCPVVFFREPWQPSKYEFHDQVIRDWGLEVWTWHPGISEFQQAGDEYELQNYYRINETVITCPTGITPPREGLPWVCALDMWKRPRQDRLQTKRIDALWIGHKQCDSDPVLGGDAGTRIDIRVLPGEPAMLFPMRHWSHADVWEYIEKHDVPYDRKRYEKHQGVWRERPGKEHNADYVHACTKCIDRREGAAQYVECPLMNATVENISGRVPWAPQEKLSYMCD